MKLMHLSDLHLGKRFNAYSMLEEQREILTQILHLADVQRPDGVLLAGDLYDKAVPPAEAVELLDDFLVALANRSIPVFLISGNHDSAERLAFGGRLMEHSGIYLSPVYDGTLRRIVLADKFGPIEIVLLPFLRPAQVRRYFPQAEIETYTDAVRTALEVLPEKTGRRVLVTHQFVTGAVRAESEEVSVGGSDNVDAAIFDGFDYVALGHLHNPQSVTRPGIRYCGTPLAYSFSEAAIPRSVSLVTLAEPGNVAVETLPLVPQHAMRALRGTYAELTARSFYEATTYREDYLHITLTDETDIPDAIGKLRSIYHRILKLDYDNLRTRTGQQIVRDEEAEKKSPQALFESFYTLQNNQAMCIEQREFVQTLMEQIWEEKS